MSRWELSSMSVNGGGGSEEEGPALSGKKSLFKIIS